MLAASSFFMTTRHTQLTAEQALKAMFDGSKIEVVPTCSISKSKFTAGLQCLKRQYLQVHHPELAAKMSVGIKEQGTRVGVLAHEAFPGGVLIATPSNHFDEAVQESARAMSDPRVEVIFESAFVADGVRVRVDIILRNKHDHGWEVGVMIKQKKKVEYLLQKEYLKDDYLVGEVKSSTSVKQYQIDDVCLQAYVLRRAGLKVPIMVIVHLNADYVYKGGEHDLNELFKITPVTAFQAQTRSDLWIKQKLNAQFHALDQPESPEIAVGQQCKKPHACEFSADCRKDLLIDDVAFIPIPFAGKWDKVEALRSQGITSISDIDPQGYTPKEREKIVIGKEALKNHCAVAYKDKLGAELLKLKFPIGFVDFETVAYAVPQLAGTKCWSAIPMQFSVDCSGTDGMTHFEYLGETDGSDPRPAFIASFLKAVKGMKTLVTYSPYEQTQIKHLAEWFPRHAKELEALLPNIWDMHKVVKGCVYHPEFRGSFSIKQVLPALVPELTYDGLEVTSGMDVLPIWDRLLNEQGMPLEERHHLRATLLQYCALDTYAMKKVLDALMKLQG